MWQHFARLVSHFLLHFAHPVQIFFLALLRISAKPATQRRKMRWRCICLTHKTHTYTFASATPSQKDPYTTIHLSSVIRILTTPQAAPNGGWHRHTANRRRLIWRVLLTINIDALRPVPTRPVTSPRKPQPFRRTKYRPIWKILAVNKMFVFGWSRRDRNRVIYLGST